jgi:hypothetical protein
LKNSPLKGALEYLNGTFPGFIKHCPISAINVVNATFDATNNTTSKFTLSPLPNGIYKIYLTFYDDIDEKIFQLIFHQEIYHRAAFFLPNLFEDAKGK